MRKRSLASRTRVILLALSIATLCAVWGAQKVSAQSEATPKSAKEAMKTSQDTKQYLFLLFYDKKDSLYDQMKEAVNNFTNRTDQKIFTYEASTSSGVDRDLITRYKIDRAPMPLLMIFGPNGAVLGGFPKSVTADKLARSLVPPLTMDILKSIQQQKMAVVLLQNSKTKFNAESSKTANDLVYDKRLLGSAEVIKADPSDPKNRDFLVNAKILGAVANATIILIAPPGIVAGVFQGDATKESIISSLSSSEGACSGGKCGPGGCS
jgi:hypothetical protein